MRELTRCRRRYSWRMEPATGTTVGTIGSITIYPIKSMKGTALEKGVVTATGLEYDRRWLVVDGAGRFLTQREEPRLCLITPSVGPTDLTIAAPGMPDIALPLAESGGDTRTVTIWDDKVEAVMAPAAIGEWLSDFLGADYHLARIPDSSVRGVDPEYGRQGDRVGFADGYPFLVISQASLDDLNERLVSRGERALPMNRFRPNLVIDGSVPFAEDGWRRVRMGTVDFRVVKPCARCVITTTDQATGARDREPLRTLAGYRNRGGKVLFGQNACHDSEGEVRVGDLVSLPASGATSL